ncbi:MAG: NADH-quinone oxidoreductase subunit B family protein [Candidatus Omnitrophota bacterium]|jgi:Ni,Fe-hydrogenase III small subunit
MNLRILKNSIVKRRVTLPLDPDGITVSHDIEGLGAELKRMIHANFGRSLHIREVDTGSCGACESEIIASSNPIYDIQRFGIDFVASPRHADALLVTGPVSKNMELALKKTYEAMPEPKFVISLGDCAKGGGLFKGSYYTCGGVENVLPVTLHIPGCPPSPLVIMKTLVSFLKPFGKLRILSRIE